MATSNEIIQSLNLDELRVLCKSLGKRVTRATTMDALHKKIAEGFEGKREEEIIEMLANLEISGGEEDIAYHSGRELEVRKPALPRGIKAPRPFLDTPGQEMGDIEEWFNLFHIYLDLNNGEDMSEKTKISILLYYIGDEARRILTAGTATYSSLEDLKEVSKRMLGKSRTLMFRRTRLFQEKQKGNVQQYANKLRILATRCEFGVAEDSVILTIFANGLKDPKTWKKLIVLKNIDFDTAVEVATIEEDEEDRTSHDEKNSFGGETQTSVMMTKEQMIMCKFCGFRHNIGIDNCPARNKECHKCWRRGHFARKCQMRTNRIGHISVQDDNSKSNEILSIGGVILQNSG
eukprot:GAHX01001821.1.p1 GENE.GAHX01001821.1~~GAHX01001821.1.p1  ORF type:complete len:348 (-),score=45.26 GAHX01001821.1:2737-3780(-)